MLLLWQMMLLRLPLLPWLIRCAVAKGAGVAVAAVVAVPADDAVLLPWLYPNPNLAMA